MIFFVVMIKKFFSVFYPFYEQYVTIKADACVQLILSLIAIFAVATVLLGLDPWSAMIIDITIASTLFNLIGLMHWWDIDFNAVSVVNLVMVSGSLKNFNTETGFAYLRCLFTYCFNIGSWNLCRILLSHNARFYH